MRKVMLAVVGLVGLVLLCGSGELLAQSGTTNAGNAMDADAADSRLQSTPSQAAGGAGPGVSFGTSGVGGTGTTTGVGGAGTAGTGTAGGASSVTSGAPQTAAAAGTGTAGMSQSVAQLQQEILQLRQEVAQLRAQLDNANANAGVGGSGQAGVAPSGAASGATASTGTAQQGAVAGGPLAGTPLRAGTAQETGTRSSTAQGEAVVNAIYTGTVRSVSGGQLVLLDEDGKPFTVQLGDRTRVLRNGQRIAAQDLKQGTRVRAVVDLLSGRNQATEVTTLPAK